MASILVIEDDDLSLQLILRALRQAGYEAVGAPNGAVGTEMARAAPPDLILSDVMMDTMDGYAALAALRQDDATATVPFILMTGQASTAGMRQGMELGADDYLPKPFTVDQLLAAVEARLKKQATTQAAAQTRLRSLRETISSALPREVRRPLSTMVTCAQALRTHAADLRPKDIVEMADAIDKAGMQVQALFEKFLTYSTLEAVAADPALQRGLKQIATRDVACLVRDRVQQVAARHGRVQDVLFEVQDGSVLMRPDYLEQIVEELADNAFAFSEPGTSVIVSTGSSDKVFTLTVQDHGCGMTTEQIATIDPFISLDRSVQERRGLGLGLAIVSRLAHLHDGVFVVESMPRQGTSTIVELPVAGD